MNFIIVTANRHSLLDFSKLHALIENIENLNVPDYSIVTTVCKDIRNNLKSTIKLLLSADILILHINASTTSNEIDLILSNTSPVALNVICTEDFDLVSKVSSTDDTFKLVDICMQCTSDNKNQSHLSMRYENIDFIKFSENNTLQAVKNGSKIEFHFPFTTPHDVDLSNSYIKKFFIPFFVDFVRSGSYEHSLSYAVKFMEFLEDA